MEDMRQPELGKRLTELRQQKSLTQEELVEACNVSVRTIQRIESGEVTPRTSTIKILLSALDADFDSFKNSIEENKSSAYLRSLETWLQIAWISGIIYFVLGFLDGILEYERLENFNEVESTSFYITSKVCYYLFYSLFLIGFVKLASYFSNYLLKISAYMLIAIFTIWTFFDIFTLFYEISDENLIAVGAGEMICYGGLSIVFGIGLMRLQDGMGNLAKMAGIFEVIAGFFFAIVVLFFLGFILLIPATIIEVILLFKAYEFIKSEKLKASL